MTVGKTYETFTGNGTSILISLSWAWPNTSIYVAVIDDNGQCVYCVCYRTVMI